MKKKILLENYFLIKYNDILLHRRHKQVYFAQNITRHKPYESTYL